MLCAVEIPHNSQYTGPCVVLLHQYLLPVILMNGPTQVALVLQGNGTAAISQQDQRVTTFDMHGAQLHRHQLARYTTAALRASGSAMELDVRLHAFKVCCAGDKNYPWKTRQRCTHDVALPDDTQDDDYMQVSSAVQERLAHGSSDDHLCPAKTAVAYLQPAERQSTTTACAFRRSSGWPLAGLNTWFDRRRNVLQVLKEWLPRLWREHRPQLVIFQAGVDSLKEDAFGRSAAVAVQCALQNTSLFGARKQVLREAPSSGPGNGRIRQVSCF